MRLRSDNRSSRFAFVCISAVAGYASVLLLGSGLRVVRAAEPSLTGQTGLVYMPDARIDPEGIWRFGISESDPYFAVWSSVSLFPRLEVSGRYTTIDGVPGFTDAPELGDYRDKAFDAKLIAIAETRFWPALALGAQDYVGTQLFSAQYLVLSKRFGEVDVTIGSGRDRIDGVFGGLRYTPAPFPRWHFTVEYDANNYRQDFRADLSGVDRRTGGATYAIGYRADWWGAQLSTQDGHTAGNVYVSVPLMEREFVPKVDEPPPYTSVTARAPSVEWREDRRYSVALLRALRAQGYTDVRVRLADDALQLSIGHDRISLASRAVGRAARTALRLGPSDLRRLEISYSENGQPILTYTFNDIALLERYFGRTASRDALAASVDVRFASSELARQLRHSRILALDEKEKGAPTVSEENDRFMVANRRPDLWRGFSVLPFNVRIFFNDPGEPVRYDTFVAALYDRPLGKGWFVDGAARFTLFENVSDIRQPSNSLLPHVRSDIGDYRREGDRLRLNALLLNKYALLHERAYGRFSLGYYEEMFAGAGGQVLLLPQRGDWALDLAVDALRQREPGEAFGFRDYSVVTALASLHYRFPRSGVTVTGRAGRFLAKDEGVRLEFKRRFRSGVEIGAWYSWTNEKDVTSPGTPDDPYRDKGLFVSIPLNSMLTRDARQRANLALADYTRDVGQMVASPGDLYRLIERPLALDSGQHDPLSDFRR